MSGTIRFEVQEASVGETVGVAKVAIIRTGDLSKAVNVQYAVTPDTATEGSDYKPVSGTITIPAGQGRVEVPVEIINNSAYELTESFVMSIITVDSGTLFAPRTTRINILDDESPIVEPPQPPLVSDYNVSREAVVNGLNSPMAIEWMPNDQSVMLVAEKSGIIRVFDTDTNQFKSDFVNISAEVNGLSDRGLMDIAVHPDFPKEPYVYAFYVVDPADTAGKTGNAGPDGAGNRYAHVVRFEADPATGYTTAIPGSKTVIVGNAGNGLSSISGAGAINSTSNFTQAASDLNADGTYKQNYLKVDSLSHAGGALEFGPDGALYISVGDGTSYNVADPRTLSVQSVDALAGKILRVDPITGEGLPDNPFVTSGVGLDSNRAKVYQLGLRNPFGMSFDSEGKLVISDTGWNSYEEVNIGGPGANFGWPFYEGGDNGTLLQTNGYKSLPQAAAFYAAVQSGQIEITEAYRAFAHAESAPGYQVQAIVGANDVVSDISRYPGAFLNDYFFSDASQGEVYAVDAENRNEVKFLFKETGFAPVHFKQGPDGYVYYTDLASGTIGRFQISDPKANAINGTAGNDYLVDTDGNDTMRGGNGMDTFALTGKGNDRVDGEGGDYNQVDLNGKASDYAFTRNGDGSITVVSADHGADLLRNIDGFWFYGENKWYSAGDLAPVIIPPGTKNTINGTAGNDYLLDTDADDTMLGGDGMDVFELQMKGNDTVDGQGGPYNQVNLLGKAADYSFVRNADGSVTVSSAAHGTDTLKNIQGFWFHGEGKWYGTDQLAEVPAPTGVNVINAGSGGGYFTGTNGNDRFNGGAGVDVFAGGKGNDVYYGGGGDYNQVDLLGKIADWDFSRNADGSYTGTHAVYGQDTFNDISAVWFEEAAQLKGLDELIG